MFDDAMDPNDAGLRELTRRLEAYAEARLSPSVAATVTMRASVMAAAQRRAATIAADTTRAAVVVATNATRAERRRTTSGRFRRPAAAFMAASLAVAVLVGTVYGAKAGGPLYASRLWVEAANLPRGPLARAQAESVRLDARIAEAQQASSDGDAPAAEAALAAYSVIVVEALDGTVGDPTAKATIEMNVSRHVVMLNQLALTVPAHARGAVQNALISSSRVMQQLDGQGKPGNNSPDAGPETVGGAVPPDATESAKPSQATDPGQGGGNDVIAGPGDPVTPDKSPSPRDHDAPPPGQTRGSGQSGTGRHRHPTPTPTSNAGHPTGHPEEPSAP